MPRFKTRRLKQLDVLIDLWINQPGWSGQWIQKQLDYCIKMKYINVLAESQMRWETTVVLFYLNMSTDLSSVWIFLKYSSPKCVNLWFCVCNYFKILYRISGWWSFDLLNAQKRFLKLLKLHMQNTEIVWSESPWTRSYWPNKVITSRAPWVLSRQLVGSRACSKYWLVHLAKLIMAKHCGSVLVNIQQKQSNKIIGVLFLTIFQSRFI